MTVELDRDDLVNLIIGCSGPYYTIQVDLQTLGDGTISVVLKI